MNKRLVLFVLLLLFFGLELAEADNANVSPPPVGVINFHKDVKVINYRFMSISMTPTDPSQQFALSLSGIGLFADINKGHDNDRTGINMNLAFFGLNGRGGDAYCQLNLDSYMLSFNPNYCFEIVGGEKKDIAGEVIKSDFSMLGYIGYKMDMGGSSFYMKSRRSSNKIGSDTFLMMGGLTFGTIAEVPVTFSIAVIPFFYMTKYMFAMIDGESIPGFAGPMVQSFGFDIFVRPMKLNPNLRISLGTALQLAEANSKDESGYSTTLILLGLQYEWGKHYSSTLIGPGIIR